MKTRRFTDSQIIAIVKQAEAGSPVPELCREHGISNATFYKWRAKYGGMDASLMARMNVERRESAPEKEVCRGASQGRVLWSNNPGHLDRWTIHRLRS
jgi:putative transposase